MLVCGKGFLQAAFGVQRLPVLTPSGTDFSFLSLQQHWSLKLQGCRFLASYIIVISGILYYHHLYYHNLPHGDSAHHFVACLAGALSLSLLHGMLFFLLDLPVMLLCTQCSSHNSALRNVLQLSVRFVSSSFCLLAPCLSS